MSKFLFIFIYNKSRAKVSTARRRGGYVATAAGSVAAVTLHVTSLRTALTALLAALDLSDIATECLRHWQFN